jgi:hypothetical protein
VNAWSLERLVIHMLVRHADVGCGDTSHDGRQQLSDTSFKGHEEIVSDVLLTRRVSCSSLKYLVRERMLCRLRDARQKHASRMRLSAKSEMSCTRVCNSSREPLLTRVPAIATTDFIVKVRHLQGRRASGRRWLTRSTCMKRMGRWQFRCAPW